MSKNIPFSILELASVAQGNTPAQTFKNSLDLAQQAEKLGYHRFWLAEHHNMISIASNAPEVLIGYIAAGTSRIRVGSGGRMLPNHSPLIVAEQFGTLGSLYPNRIDLGLGRAPGTDQLTAHAIRSDRNKSIYRFPEEITEIQTYFSDNKEAKVRAAVAEGVDVPIYVLGSSTDSAHVAAEKGLPYAFASHFAPDQLFQALSIYHNRFQPSQYLDAPYTIGCINVLAADTEEKAERLSTTLLHMIYGVLTGKIDYMKAPTEMTEDMHALMANPSFERMMKYAFIGSKSSIQPRIDKFLQDTGVNEVMVASHIFDHEDRIRSYEIFSQVMTELNSVPIVK